MIDTNTTVEIDILTEAVKNKKKLTKLSEGIYMSEEGDGKIYIDFAIASSQDISTVADAASKHNRMVDPYQISINGLGTKLVDDGSYIKADIDFTHQIEKQYSQEDFEKDYLGVWDSQQITGTKTFTNNTNPPFVKDIDIAIQILTAHGYFVEQQPWDINAYKVTWPDDGSGSSKSWVFLDKDGVIDLSLKVASQAPSQAASYARTLKNPWQQPQEAQEEPTLSTGFHKRTMGEARQLAQAMQGDYASNYADTKLSERTIIAEAFKILKDKKHLDVMWHNYCNEYDVVTTKTNKRISYSIYVPQAPGSGLETVTEILLLHEAFTLMPDSIDTEARLHENLDINTFIILRVAYLIYKAFAKGKDGSNRLVRIYGQQQHPKFTF